MCPLYYGHFELSEVPYTLIGQKSARNVQKTRISVLAILDVLRKP